VWEMCSARWWERRDISDDEAGDAATVVPSNTGEESGDSVLVPQWWRPLSREARHWERFAEASTAPLPTSVSKLPSHSDETSLPGVPTSMRPIPSSSQPNPPNIPWTHIWGTVKWGKRAGTWGKGVEGMEERRREKGAEDKKNEGSGEGKGQ
jgi:hypothetical protein